MPTRPAAGRKTNRRPDDRADDLDDRERLVRNDVIEKLVRDVRSIAFTLEKPAEDGRGLFVASGVVPAEAVQGALAGLVRTVRPPLAYTLKKMASVGRYARFSSSPGSPLSR